MVVKQALNVLYFKKLFNNPLVSHSWASYHKLKATDGLLPHLKVM